MDMIVARLHVEAASVFRRALRWPADRSSSPSDFRLSCARAILSKSARGLDSDSARGLSLSLALTLALSIAPPEAEKALLLS